MSNILIAHQKIDQTTVSTFDSFLVVGVIDSDDSNCGMLKKQLSLAGSTSLWTPQVLYSYPENVQFRKCSFPPDTFTNL